MKRSTIYAYLTLLMSLCAGANGGLFAVSGDWFFVSTGAICAIAAWINSDAAKHYAEMGK